MASEHWKDEPEAEDFPAAESFLSLLVGAEAASKLAKALRKERSLKNYAAKDILRAATWQCSPSGLRGRHRPEQGQGWQQTLARAPGPRRTAVGRGQIRRICASYHLDEKTEVPCRIVSRTH